MPSEPRRVNAVSVHGVWKRYGLPWPFRRSEPNGAPSWALRDVHLTVAPGEAVALLGRNGAAKTTLLRLIAGVTPPSAGTVEVHGSLFPLVGLDAAIHPELKGRENVRLLATLAGMSARARGLAMADIERFTQLGGWFDRPVRTYSLGMAARLGVAVALYSGCDILLLDEALAVGDLEFQSACLRRLRALRDAGTTVLFATHNLDLAELMADRTVVLERGEVRFVGPPAEAGGAYEDIVFDAAHRRASSEARRERQGRVWLRHARVYDARDRTVAEVGEETPFGLELGITGPADTRWRLSVGWRNVGGVVCVWHMVDLALPPSHGDGALVLRIWYPENHLVKGAYVADVRVMAWQTGEVAATWAAAESVNIRATHRARGIANMRAECVVRGPFGERPLPADTEPLAWTEA